MEISLLLSTFLLLTTAQTCRCFLFDNANCAVSEWTRWSGVSDYGMRYRERKILRYPSGNGDECPSELFDTEEVDIESIGFTPFPVEVTANIMIDNFIRPSKLGLKRSANPSTKFRDLLLIVDSSGSIGQSEFQTSLLELTALLNVLCPEKDPFNIRYNRAALIEFSAVSNEIFDFDDYSNTADVMSAIRGIQYLAQSTCTGDAFDMAFNMFNTAKGARTDNPAGVIPEVLIITDGQSNCGVDAIAAAKRLQSKADVYALVIGIQDATAAAEMRSYVSAPQSNHLFALPNFNDLSKLVALVLSQMKKGGTRCAPFNP